MLTLHVTVARGLRRKGERPSQDGKESCVVRLRQAPVREERFEGTKGQCRLRALLHVLRVQPPLLVREEIVREGAPVVGRDDDARPQCLGALARLPHLILVPVHEKGDKVLVDSEDDGVPDPSQTFVGRGLAESLRRSRE